MKFRYIYVYDIPGRYRRQIDSSPLCDLEPESLNLQLITHRNWEVGLCERGLCRSALRTPSPEAVFEQFPLGVSESTSLLDKSEFFTGESLTFRGL